ncbi:MAG: S8 family serine peptidase, partial [Chloroflexota bacterium]
TSMAAPHVAGLISLMIAREPTLTPDQVLSALQDSARTFPASSDCDTASCGAGIVDAFRALSELAAVDYANKIHLPLLMNPAEPLNISFSSATYSAGEGGGAITVRIKLSRAAGQQVSVSYSTSNGSAKAGSDYVAKSAQVSFSPGQVSKNVNISILDDGKQEVAETFTVNLHGAQGATLAPPAQATVTIHDNDGPSGGIVNGDFEAGRTGWTEYSYFNYPLILDATGLPVLPYNGFWAAWLGGANNEIAFVEQTVPIPAGAPYLTYWHWIDSEDDCGWDHGIVVIDGDTIADFYDLCVAQDTGGWVRYSADLSPWAGQTVAVQIRIQNDNLYVSNLFVDDVAFTSAPASSGTTQTGPRPTLRIDGAATATRQR